MSILGEQLSAPAPTDHDVEQVLLGLADGSYVLSTPGGLVAECGTGVLALLGARAEDLAGQPVAGILASAAEPPQLAEFERLMRGEVSGAEQVFQAATASGALRSLRLVVVCVPLALGWEFTSLLSELGSRDADTWHPEALRMRHERALDAVEGVCVTGAQPDPGARLAGILIVVRDAEAPPLTREDVGERMAKYRAVAREAKEAERRAALGLDELHDEPSAGAQGLEDLVERAQLLRARVEEAEREAAEAHAEREQALARLQSEQAEHEQALARLAEAEAERDAEFQRRQVAEAGAHDGRLERVETERDEAFAAATAADAEAEVLRGELHAAQEREDTMRAELEARCRELSEVRSALAAREHDLGAVRARLHDDIVAYDARGTELAQAHEEIETLRRELETVRGELETTRTAADDVRAEREQARLRASELLGEAERARAAADAIRAEFAFDAPPAAADTAAAPQSPSGQPVVVSTPLALHPASASQAAPPAEPAPELPQVGPGMAAALIGLDGTFKRLDEAFCSLLGCREDELRNARWPSIIDRDNLAEHQEIARRLRSGEIQSAEIETVYMHKRGLLVPVEGTISLHRDPAGHVTHFLFRADVRRTSGATR